MEEKVFNVLNELKIEYEKIEHPALYTMEDCEKYNIKMDGVECKNLFLRNKDKSKYYLISLPLEKRADLKAIQEKLGETRLSFGSDDILFEKLGIKSGSVSLLNIIEVEKTDVKFIIDKCVLDANKVGFHPNVNTATVLFKPQCIDTIMKKYDADYEFMEI